MCQDQEADICDWVNYFGLDSSFPIKGESLTGLSFISV